MTQPEDMKRQWDGLENVESVKRVANLLHIDEPRISRKCIVNSTAASLAIWGFIIIAWFAWSQK